MSVELFVATVGIVSGAYGWIMGYVAGRRKRGGG